MEKKKSKNRWEMSFDQNIVINSKLENLIVGTDNIFDGILFQYDVILWSSCLIKLTEVIAPFLN